MYKASEGGHLQVVELLLSKGAEVDSRNYVSTYNNVMYCVVVIIQSVWYECVCDMSLQRACNTVNQTS